MSPHSRRAFLAAVGATLLAGCAGGGPADRAASTPPASPVTSSGAAADVARPLARSAPVVLRIPAIGVDTPVVRLGLQADGSVEVPAVTPDDRAGWYRYSPTPGQRGPSVILGHVTVGRYGDGVFRRLDRLRPGDGITARLENGTSADFAVTAVRTVGKAEFPTADVYGNVDRPELRLITCGGPVTEDGYRDNVIVFAVLTSAGER
ncbi:class F sortase [Streptomyces sp. NPDC048737]|uniref:class F sortase n=1 Tax=unclassified Streptomyces TaxID=2593676 RepID=UPI00342CBE8C